MDLLKYSEVAKELRCSTGTVKRLVYQGVIPALKLSDRVVRIRREDFAAALEASRTGAA